MNDINWEAAKKQRRERMRWFILRTLDVSRPAGSYASSVLDVLRTVYADATELEVRRELDYLAERELVSLAIDPTGVWYAKLERFGVDVVEYAVDCEAGIARPVFGGA